MKITKTIVRMTAALMLTIVFSAVSMGQNLQSISVNGSQTDHSKVAAAIDQTGLIYTKVDKSMWSVEVELGEEQKVLLGVNASSDVVGVFLVLSSAPETISDELKDKFNALNNSFLVAKFIYDKSAVYIKVDSLIYNFDGAILGNHISRIIQITSREEVQDLIKLLPKPEAQKPQ